MRYIPRIDAERDKKACLTRIEDYISEECTEENESNKKYGSDHPEERSGAHRFFRHLLHCFLDDGRFYGNERRSPVALRNSVLNERIR